MGSLSPYTTQQARHFGRQPTHGKKNRREEQVGLAPVPPRSAGVRDHPCLHVDSETKAWGRRRRTMVKWWSVVLVLAVSFWSGRGCTPVYAAGDVFEQASLRGLNTVQVVVEDLALDVTQDGLNREHIKAAVEQQLQHAGIGVEQQADTALYVHLGTVKNSAGLYSYG